MAKTVNKHIRIEATLWELLEAAARDRETTANRLLAELATQWLRNREWPATDVQLQVARSSLFTAQAMVRNLIAEKTRERDRRNPPIHLDNHSRSIPGFTDRDRAEL